MKNRILIFEERGKKQDFVKSVTAVKDKANSLIELFNQAQPWKRIETIEDFEKVNNDPLKLLDQTLISNIDLKIAGGRMPVASALASLMGIDRPAFMKSLGIAEITKEDDCPDCAKKAQSIKVKNIRSNAEHNQFAEYLFFIGGLFQLNNKAINEHCDIFNIYAESPEQIALFNHWQSLCDSLNNHFNKYTFGMTDKNNIARILKLQLSDGGTGLNGKFVINSYDLSEQIKYLK